MENLEKHWLQYTIELSRKCPSSDSAFAVGAAIVDEKGILLADGFSRETDPKIHAEESVLQKLKDKNIDFTKTTLYSSLEPCSKRLSQPKSCTQLIIDSGIKQVVFVAIEPPIFVQGRGAQRLREAGISIFAYSEFEKEVIAVQTQVIKQQWLNS